ncbi:hypothetical protein BJV74DRAFT_852932 [Russula compacta]|nr:hypothetical protein BJV74DRAFT_852932 [Russula compacta]
MSLSRFLAASADQSPSAPATNKSHSLLRSQNVRRRFRTCRAFGCTLLATDRSGGSELAATRTTQAELWKIHWTNFILIGSARTCGSAGLAKRNRSAVPAGGSLSGMSWGGFSCLAGQLEHKTDTLPTVLRLLSGLVNCYITHMLIVGTYRLLWHDNR